MEILVDVIVHIIATITVAGSFLYRAVSAKDHVSRLLNGILSLALLVLFMSSVAGMPVMLVSWVVSVALFSVLWGKAIKQEP